MGIRKLDHVALLAKEVERSRRFSLQILEMEEVPRPRGDGVIQMSICDPDRYIVELIVWQK